MRARLALASRLQGCQAMMGHLPSLFRRIAPFLPAATLSAGVTALAASSGFLDPASLLVTVGGTLVVTALTFPLTTLRTAVRLSREALTESPEYEAIIAFLKRAARIQRVEGPRALELAAQEAPEAFVREAIECSLVCEDDDEVRQALDGEIRRRQADGESARQVLLTMGKLFPAFGLIGTLLGLVLLLRRLSVGDIEGIMPGLGLSVLTTLYGAFLSNVVALPLATKLAAHLAQRQIAMQLTADGVLLVRRSEFPTRVERLLRARIAGTSAELTPPPTRLRLVAESAA